MTVNLHKCDRCGATCNKDTMVVHARKWFCSLFCKKRYWDDVENKGED